MLIVFSGASSGGSGSGGVYGGDGRGDGGGADSKKKEVAASPLWMSDDVEFWPPDRGKTEGGLHRAAFLHL